MGGAPLRGGPAAVSSCYHSCASPVQAWTRGEGWQSIGRDDVAIRERAPGVSLLGACQPDWCLGESAKTPGCAQRSPTLADGEVLLSSP